MRRVSLRLSLMLFLVWGSAGCQGVEGGPSDSGSSKSQVAAAPQVNLLAMGDWGSGYPSQKEVADALANYVRSADRQFDGMLLAGDNFYPQIFGTDDPQWRTLFEEMYDPKVLNFPFYVALGNHDYDDDHPNKDIYELEYARENPQSRWKLPARHYRLEIPEKDPLVTVLMLDSNHNPRKGNEEKPESFRWQEHMAWLEKELAKPRKSKWLICVAHHPLFSNGDHGDDPVMQYTWGPLFRQHGVDMYISGHDHDLQHLEIDGWPLSFILVGGGGAHVRPMLNDSRGPFSKSVYGFATLSFTPSVLTVKFIAKDGSTLHTFQRTKDGHVKVIESVPSDKVERKASAVNQFELWCGLQPARM